MMRWLALSAVLTGCVTTKVVLYPGWNPRTKPVYEDYFDSYVFGFIGRPSVNLPQVCMDQKPYAFVKQRSGEDITLAIFTLGIYTPTTVRVWCGD